jgi:hypothetical protein
MRQGHPRSDRTKRLVDYPHPVIRHVRLSLAALTPETIELVIGVIPAISPTLAIGNVRRRKHFNSPFRIAVRPAYPEYAGDMEPSAFRRLHQCGIGNYDPRIWRTSLLSGTSLG